ncbi:MAG: hypothetical protein IJA12_07105 [Oscillospiraceae bacterium]|nr:hypothetical protein [Oscillospiraceae bacterium]
MNDYFISNNEDEKVPEYRRKIVQHEYSWKKYKCSKCGREKKMSSIILKLYSVPKCCGKDMECIAAKK